MKVRSARPDAATNRTDPRQRQPPMRVVVAMSGGVDSSVAAALLAQAGHDVIGLSMQLYDQSGGDVRFGSCCTIDDLHDARRVAARLGIPHYIVNFERGVRRSRRLELRQGVRGGPDADSVRPLQRRPEVRDAGGARARDSAPSSWPPATTRASSRTTGPATYLLKRGLDAAKDQSYFLFTLTQAQLAHASFPVGALDKHGRAESRARAWPAGRRQAGQPRDLLRAGRRSCGVRGGSRRRRSRRRHPRPRRARSSGRTPASTASPSASARGSAFPRRVPLYVVGIDAGQETVTVGPRAALERRTVTASGVNWIAGSPPAGRSRVTAQIRHRHPEAPATAAAEDDDRVRLEFDRPQHAVAPGQAVVMYDGDEVVGGGWIEWTDAAGIGVRVRDPCIKTARPAVGPVPVSTASAAIAAARHSSSRHGAQSSSWIVGSAESRIPSRQFLTRSAALRPGAAAGRPDSARRRAPPCSPSRRR